MWTAEIAFPNAGLAIIVYERAADTLRHPTMARFIEVLDGEGLEELWKLIARLPNRTAA